MYVYTHPNFKQWDMHCFSDSFKTLAENIGETAILILQVGSVICHFQGQLGNISFLKHTVVLLLVNMYKPTSFSLMAEW